MRSSFKHIGSYVQQVNARNSGVTVTNLQGVSINKKFMPSVANINGTDLSTYKVVSKEQFAFNPMHVGRDEVLPIAMLETEDQIIVSPAYVVFEIIDKQAFLPEYLMMWCRRSEFDRNAWFTTDSSVRGGFSWNDFCEMELPVPSPEKQREIVKEYHTIVDRIKLNERLNAKLEETAQAIYKQWFVDFEFPISAEYAAVIGKPEIEGQPYKSSGGEMVFNKELEQEIPRGWDVKPISDIISVKDGTHDSPPPVDVGKPLVTSTHLGTFDVNLDDAYKISEKDFQDVNKRSKVDQFDILISMIGTVGNICYVLREEINFAIKNIGLFKTSERKELSAYIFQYLKSSTVTRYIETCLLGSTQSYITLGELRDIPIFLPPSDVLLKFTDALAVIIHNAYLGTREVYLCQSIIEIILGRLAQQHKEC